MEIVDMTKLLKSNELKNKDETIKLTSRIDNQSEVTFFGGIDEEYIQLVIPLIYPNFSKNFQQGYHDKIWDLTEETYNQIKHDIWESSNNVNIGRRNEITKGLAKFIIKVCSAISLLQNKKPYYYTPINTVKPWTEEVEVVQKDIMSYIRTGTGQNNENLEMCFADDTICKSISFMGDQID